MQKNCASPACSATKTCRPCHYCHTLYCSRSCRQSDWVRHKTKCTSARLAWYCKKLLAKVGRSAQLRHELSKIALTAYENFQTKGFVWLDFEAELDAHNFLASTMQQSSRQSNFLSFFGNNLLPKFVRATPGRLSESKILTQLFLNYLFENEVINFGDLIQNYKAHKEFILVVSVKLPSENLGDEAKPRRFHIGTRGFTYVFKYMKVNLRIDSKRDQKELSSPSTLILTSLNKASKNCDRENRQLFMANLLNEFQSRGISLRDKYPKIYRDLCLYVEENRAFTPLCLFPTDVKKNNLFMCLIMPGSDPISYESWLNVSQNLLELTRDESSIELIQAQFRLAKYLQIE
ncbi:phosphohistidine phosphatase -like protein [Brachionus plicatilis]|uniref:Phosphohistidine phosphatase-like protein n=1 Tax=Brachionus plicatilis TaxID=10195 RepID=A0A3M7Q5Y8_BRAPC|nr:phosphohistidine phosphatase -like protein [Brachionus plicatilis]